MLSGVKLSKYQVQNKWHCLQIVACKPKQLQLLTFKVLHKVYLFLCLNKPMKQTGPNGQHNKALYYHLDQNDFEVKITPYRKRPFTSRLKKSHGMASAVAKQPRAARSMTMRKLHDLNTFSAPKSSFIKLLYQMYL